MSSVQCGIEGGDGKVCRHLDEETVASGKWICLKKFTYQDAEGLKRTWETTSRTTTSNSNVDAAAVIAVLKRTLHCDCIVLVRQYRPPVKKYTLEFPCGLVNANESIEDAALRELKEETGYTAVFKHISPVTSLDAGLEDCTLVLVTVEIDGDSPENLHPKQELDDAEDIKTLLIPVGELLERLNAYSKEGNMIDSRVYSYAIALTQASKQRPVEPLVK